MYVIFFLQFVKVIHLLFGPRRLKSLTSESLYGNSKTIDFKFKMNGNDLYSSNYDIKNYTRHFPGKYFNNIPPLDRIGVYSLLLNQKYPTNW